MRAAIRIVYCLFAGVGLLVALRSVELRGQEQAPAQSHPAVPRNVIVLDPAHGGSDPGADLGNKVAEKDVTLSLATKLRTALTATGFSVVLTRDTDTTTAVTSDQRAQTANHSHALACVSLHATRSGSGIHIYTSALQPPSDAADSGFVPTRWESIQEHFVTQSAQFAGDLRSAFTAASLTADVRTATVPPIDNLACPAVAIEFAPIQNVSTPGKGADDSTYQGTAVNAIANALAKWRADTTPQQQSATPAAKDAQ